MVRLKPFITIISGFALVTFVKAVSCNLSNAEPVRVDSGNNGGASNGGGGGGGGGGYPNLYGCVNLETYENRCEIQYRRLLLKRSHLTFAKRDDLSCTNTEACVSIDSEALCYNPSTEDFHLEDGTKGNFRTGDFLLSDGQRGNLWNGPNPTPYSLVSTGTPLATTRTSKVHSSSTSVSMTEAADIKISSLSVSMAGSSSSSPTVSPTPATTPLNSGNQNLVNRHVVGAAIGIVGLLAL